MAGRMGGNNVTTPNVLIAKIDPDLGLLFLKGAIPGPYKGIVYIRDALRKPLPLR